MREDEINNPGYEGLIEAIAKLAAKDIRYYRPNRRCTEEQRRIEEKNFRSAKAFFNSQWFATLTGVDGKPILEKLLKEMDDRRRGWI